FAGGLQLGNVTLTAGSLQQSTPQLEAWRSSLGEDADLFLYGCSIAGGTTGIEFVNQLANVLNVDIAASIDATGVSSLGGDWDLEYQVGQTLGNLTVSEIPGSDWEHLLLTYTVRDDFASAAYTNNNGTNSWSAAWSETDAAGAGATTGNILITGGQLQMQAANAADLISRQANLTGAHSATLSFTYDNTLDNNASASSITVDVSSDGVTWVTLDTFSRTLNTTASSKSYNISSYISSGTRVRFDVGTAAAGAFYLFVDNFQISYDINTAPVLNVSASPTMGLVLEGATNPSGVSVATLVVDGSITDDGSAAEAIAITGLNASLGSWQYSLNGGMSWLTINANLINNTTNELALLLGPTAQLRLIPFGDVNGSVSDGITFRAWDQTSGSEGQYTAITATGGTSAFSTASDTASITVTAINDAPTFFSGDGIVTTDFGTSNDFGYSVTLQPDGKIVVAGLISNGSNTDFALTRYNADGSLDTSFGTGGIVTTDLGAYDDYATSVTLQSDGKIVVAGYSDTLQSDGKIVVAGYSDTGYGYGEVFALTRYNADGSLDTSFGDGYGIVTTNVGADIDVAYSVTLQPDGKIVVAGASFNGSNYEFTLTRYNANGSLDTSFGGGDGIIITTDVGAGSDEARSVTLQSDGKIVVAGNSWNGSNNDFALVRYNADGSLDTSFGTGQLSGSVSFTEGGAAVVLDADVQVLDPELSVADNFSAATLTLARNGGANAQDVFSATGTLSSISATSGNLVVGGTTIGTYTNADGTLVFTFNSSATNALVNSAMQQIAYANSSDAPPASAQINWTFSDGNSWAQGTGGALTATGNVIVNITAVNDAPVLNPSASPTMGLVLEGATNPSGVTVASLVVDGSITDADGSAVESIAITGLNTSLGTWQYSLNGGTSWLTIDANLINNTTNELALLLGPTAQLRLIPFGVLNGAVSDAITFRGWDQTSGSEGQ
ncbi:MAG: DUF4347 domain-containing protein, partial [Planctomycetales bacterium]|nr:DUF4347 domain-containing protein [Planctomycetales bacterium]